MAEDENKNLNAESAENGAATETDKADTKAGKPEKKPKLSAAEKRAAKKSAAEKSRAQKEWEDSLVVSKRVKLEEVRRKLKKVMVALLVFAIVTTSIVYIMLLFIDENNIRITASTSSDEKNISLSMDRANWLPYLNADGPKKMIDLSYNSVYGREHIPTLDEIKSLLELESPILGTFERENYISFCFALRNGSSGDIGDIEIYYEMTLKKDDRGLDKAIRISWGESFSQHPEATYVAVYAASSTNARLQTTESNLERSVEQGFIEKVSYPLGSDDTSSANYNLSEYEQSLYATENGWENAALEGYFDTVPFMSDDYVLQRQTKLSPGEFMYVYINVWIEGSDFECRDSALGGYVSLTINFTVM
jgi:hypothetical protein